MSDHLAQECPTAEEFARSFGADYDRAKRLEAERLLDEEETLP
jgi:hypothetical protein